MAAALAARAAPLELTAAQARWLTAHPVITIASDPAWPPFSFADERGQISGIDVELTRLLEQRLGVRFERRPVHDWTEALELGRRGAVDALSGTARVPAREDRFVFTSSYLSQSIGIVARVNEPFFATLGSLAGRRVAAPRDHTMTMILRRDYPQLQLVLVDTAEQALRLVSDGGADAVLTNLVNASYTIKMRGLTNLKIAGIAPYRYEMRFAVRRDWPELAAILDGAIASLDEAEKQRILDRWVRVDYAQMVRWDVVGRIATWLAAGVAIVVGGLWWHDFRLRRELVARARIEAELRTARDRLAELNEEKTKLINMAAHDLRNPLSGILLSLSLVDTADERERRRVVGDITRLSRHMHQLITDLLDLELLQEGRRVFRLVNFDCSALVREAVLENEPAARRKRITLDATEATAVAAVRADPGATRQVIDNLISNALKYSPVGARVRLGLGGAGRIVRLEVRDEGPGIAPADLPRLFTKYARLGGRPTGGESSVGLGLSIVRQLVESMQGRVWCESEFGRGTTFIVELQAASLVEPGATGRELTNVT